MLKFSAANSKIEALSQVPEIAAFLAEKRKVYSFDLLSGFSCPYANECLSKAKPTETGSLQIVDGPNTKFRCFSASQEVLFKAVYNLRKRNFDTLRAMQTSAEMAAAISSAIPKNAGIIRLHVGGDFFNPNYFLAWLQVVESRPDILFYAYTKSLPFWISNMEKVQSLPNFVLTASYGGRYDSLIREHGLRASIVVFSEMEAQNANLPIDHDDSHAAVPSLRNENFALMLHGIQPKGSEASEALKVLKRDNVKHSYSPKRKKVKV